MELPWSAAVVCIADIPHINVSTLMHTQTRTAQLCSPSHFSVQIDVPLSGYVYLAAVAEGADGIKTRTVAVPMLNKPSRLTRGGPPFWCVGRTDSASAQSTQRVAKFYIRYWTWADTLWSVLMGRACGTHGAVKKYIRLSVEKPEWKESFGRPGYREEGNIKLDLHELRWKDMLLSLGSCDGLLWTQW
jgi:hypothetical protein